MKGPLPWWGRGPLPWRRRVLLLDQPLMRRRLNARDEEEPCCRLWGRASLPLMRKCLIVPVYDWVGPTVQMRRSLSAPDGLFCPWYEGKPRYPSWGRAMLLLTRKGPAAPDEEEPRCPIPDEKDFCCPWWSSTPLPWWGRASLCSWRGKALLPLMNKSLLAPDEEEPWCLWWGGALLPPDEEGPYSTLYWRTSLWLIRKGLVAPVWGRGLAASKKAGRCCPDEEDLYCSWKGRASLAWWGEALLPLMGKSLVAQFISRGSNLGWYCLLGNWGVSEAFDAHTLRLRFAEFVI